MEQIGVNEIFLLYCGRQNFIFFGRLIHVWVVMMKIMSLPGYITFITAQRCHRCEIHFISVN